MLWKRSSAVAPSRLNPTARYTAASADAIARFTFRSLRKGNKRCPKGHMVLAQLRRRNVAASPHARRMGHKRGSVQRRLSHNDKCDILTPLIPQVEEPRQRDQLRYSRRAPSSSCRRQDLRPHWPLTFLFRSCRSRSTLPCTRRPRRCRKQDSRPRLGYT